MSNASSFRRLLLHMGGAALRLIRDHKVDRMRALEAVAQAATEEMGLERPIGALSPAFALAWAECGFALVEPSHRLAASLMATTMPQEHVDEFVRVPWRCFGFVCPAGLLQDTETFALILHAHDGMFRLLSITDGGMFVGAEPSLADWNLKFNREIKQGDEVLVPGHEDYEESRQQFLKSEMLGRLLIGICAEMGLRPDGETGPRTSTSATRRTSDEPKAAVFKLTRAVTVDARSAVRDYVDGRTRSSPSVQVLVRGHWKLQPHGENRALRKLIHVEPYWRGPDDAPIGVRPHVLKEKP